jgi:hypothetical protein
VSITRKGRALRKKMWKIYEATVGELFLPQFNAGEQAAFSSALNRAAGAVGPSHAV